MVSYIYLGYGITGSNGIAKLDHDADGEEIDHSYTGSGVGEVDVVASLDNPITSGSVVSQPNEVLDCEYYETIPNGALSQGGFISEGASVSSDWSSVGGYSIKVDITNLNWSGWRVYNPTISKKGVLMVDVHSANALSRVGIFLRIDTSDVGSWVRFNQNDTTITIHYDLTSTEGTVNRLDVRGIKESSEYTNPIYLDNIRIYPE